jgi:hypothetical protein
MRAMFADVFVFSDREVVKVDIHLLGSGDKIVVLDLGQPLFPFPNLCRCLVCYATALGGRFPSREILAPTASAG